MNLAISYSEMRKRLKSSFDKVCQDHEPLLVTRKNGENVVVISEADFRSLQETAYLCQSPKNLERLLEALHRSEGKTLQENIELFIVSKMKVSEYYLVDTTMDKAIQRRETSTEFASKV